MTRFRQVLIRSSLALLLLAVLGVVAAHWLAPYEVRWRLAVLEAKLAGRLDEMPLANVLQWLMPGSAVYLEPLATTPNPHAQIRNGYTGTDDVAQGKLLFLRTCGACHGDSGHGNIGPNLIEAVANRSDWFFFATAKWGRHGTAMQAQPLTDLQIWRVHAFLRSNALAASAQAGAAAVASGTAHHVDVAWPSILESDAHPGQWLTYAGNYAGHRHTLLPQLTKGNVANLKMAWALQMRQVDRELQVSPIVANGVMYLTESRDGVVALDAKSGKVLWTYRREVPDGIPGCCGTPNRGVAVLGQTVFVPAADAHLIALDANTGKQRWIVKVADYADGYSITGAPMVLADKVITGVAGGEVGIRGFIAAFDLNDGHLLWKFFTVPGPGEPGHETWSGDAWKTGGAPTWSHGAYDPEQDLIIWGTGNPSPLFKADVRPGDNLYSNSVVALEAKTGRLRWHYQFTPADDHDWDSTQQPVLTDIDWQGGRRAVVLWANRNGFFYALDRHSGEFLFAKPFVKQTWNEGFDAKGRPRMAASARPSAAGAVVWPAIMAATNWWPPSYDASRQLFFVPCSEAAGVYYKGRDVKYERGKRFEGSVASFYAPNLPTTAYIKAVDARTGEIRWQTALSTPSADFVWTVDGVLSTRSGVVFTGYRDDFRAFDADTGRELWQMNLGGRVRGPPISFLIEGQQYIAVAAGHTVFVFVLPASR